MKTAKSTALQLQMLIALKAKRGKALLQPFGVANMARFIIKTLDNAKLTYVAFSAHLLLGFVYGGLISYAAIR